LETDHGLEPLTYGIEPLVLMGLEPIRGNGGNKFEFGV